MNSLPEHKFSLYDEKNIKELNISKSEQITLLPNFELENIEKNSIDLFINTGSLSEMDYKTVAEYIEKINYSTKKYFLTENSIESNVNRGHKEVSLNEFPINTNSFKTIYNFPSIFGAKRYNEVLFEKINNT
jgi:hypothetical protein